jgi:hypothetical protein
LSLCGCKEIDQHLELKEKRIDGCQINTRFTFNRVERPGFAFVKMSITSVYRIGSVSLNTTRAIIEGWATSISMFSRRKTESDNPKV